MGLKEGRSGGGREEGDGWMEGEKENSVETRKKEKSVNSAGRPPLPPRVSSSGSKTLQLRERTEKAGGGAPRGRGCDINNVYSVAF